MLILNEEEISTLMKANIGDNATNDDKVSYRKKNKKINYNKDRMNEYSPRERLSVMKDLKGKPKDLTLKNIKNKYKIND